ncbi:hypothetical protein B0H16DRAFT_1556871 [Mycena metata]|uniref:Uncharacterized protein n=1 Tax=Mycena metata TaxID=1033252 RepID=A0AAD7IPE4_9AGAR|nr:hypothetical protein B0H16DRAFT_1556871 [Mycena metata]
MSSSPETTQKRGYGLRVRRGLGLRRGLPGAGRPRNPVVEGPPGDSSQVQNRAFLWLPFADCQQQTTSNSISHSSAADNARGILDTFLSVKRKREIDDSEPEDRRNGPHGQSSIPVTRETLLSDYDEALKNAVKDFTQALENAEKTLNPIAQKADSIDAERLALAGHKVLGLRVENTKLLKDNNTLKSENALLQQSLRTKETEVSEARRNSDKWEAKAKRNERLLIGIQSNVAQAQRALATSLAVDQDL